jgi:hypothetical protein
VRLYVGIFDRGITSAGYDVTLGSVGRFHIHCSFVRSFVRDDDVTVHIFFDVFFFDERAKTLSITSINGLIDALIWFCVHDASDARALR